MAFNTQEQEIIKYGIVNGKSRQEVEQAISNYRSGVTPTQKAQETPKETLGSKLENTASETTKNISNTLNSNSDNASKVLQVAGNVGKGVIQVTGDVVSSTPVAGDVLGAVSKPISQGLQAVNKWISDNPSVQKAVTNETSNAIADFLDQHPDIAKNAQAVNDIANAILIVKSGVKTAGDVVSVASKVPYVIESANTGIINAAKTGAQTVVDNPVIQGTKDIVKMASEGISRVPERIKTNVAERKAVDAEIKSLPTQTAQTAVHDGVDIIDVKNLASIPRTPQVNKVIQTIKDYASGNRKVDPIEVIGAETTKRFKELVKQKKEIGSKLGEASETIGILTKPELQGGVLSRLQKVNGLENIKLTPSGKLNFKDTILEANIPSAISDRKAIQNAYDQSVKWGDGKKAHLYRQTLFEDLGGKKKGGVELTGTQEKAFNAIRQGLSDVIETKSPSYKKYSNEYRKIVEPIEELRKRIKTLDPNAEDFSDANLGAGLLARRITSTAVSNPEIRALLKKMDSVGNRKGSSFKNTLEMQDMYNILNKYYDIAPKTGYQNLTKEGVSASPLGMIKETLTDVSGKSNAVRQKALEDLLAEQGIVLK